MSYTPPNPFLPRQTSQSYGRAVVVVVVDSDTVPNIVQSQSSIQVSVLPHNLALRDSGNSSETFFAQETTHGANFGNFTPLKSTACERSKRF